MHFFNPETEVSLFFDAPVTLETLDKKLDAIKEDTEEIKEDVKDIKEKE